MPNKEAAKTAGADDIMETSELKAILAQARRGQAPSCAIALTKDKEGVILLDKRKKPKQLVAELKKSASGLGLALETTTLRFGRATVDPDLDATLLTLSVNKDAPGAMRPRLLERFKKAGFAKLEIVVDGALETEPEEEERPEVAPSPAAASPGAPESSAPDAGKLTRQLADLVRRIPSVLAKMPGRKEELVQLATDAQAGIKKGDGQGASALIETLQERLDSASKDAEAPRAGAATAVDPVVARKLQKAVDVWEATLGKMTRDLDQLSQRVAAATKGHQLGETIERDFEKVIEPLVKNLDTTLSDLLKKAATARSQDSQTEVLEKARDVTARYRKLLQSNPVIEHLDTNPFVPMAMGKMLTASLSAISTALG